MLMAGTGSDGDNGKLSLASESVVDVWAITAGRRVAAHHKPVKLKAKVVKPVIAMSG